LDRPSPDDIQMLLDHPNANSQPTLNVNKSLSTFLPNFRFPQLHFLGERVEAKWVHDDDYYGLFFNATVTKLHEDGYVDVLFTDDKRTAIERYLTADSICEQQERPNQEDQVRISGDRED
jgi:hypothetical protein